MQTDYILAGLLFLGVPLALIVKILVGAKRRMRNVRRLFEDLGLDWHASGALAEPEGRGQLHGRKARLWAESRALPKPIDDPRSDAERHSVVSLAIKLRRGSALKDMLIYKNSLRGNSSAWKILDAPADFQQAVWPEIHALLARARTLEDAVCYFEIDGENLFYREPAGLSPFASTEAQHTRLVEVAALTAEMADLVEAYAAAAMLSPP